MDHSSQDENPASVPIGIFAGIWKATASAISILLNVFNGKSEPKQQTPPLPQETSDDQPSGEPDAVPVPASLKRPAAAIDDNIVGKRLKVSILDTDEVEEARECLRFLIFQEMETRDYELPDEIAALVESSERVQTEKHAD